MKPNVLVLEQGGQVSPSVHECAIRHPKVLLPLLFGLFQVEAGPTNLSSQAVPSSDKVTSDCGPAAPWLTHCHVMCSEMRLA